MNPTEDKRGKGLAPRVTTFAFSTLLLLGILEGGIRLLHLVPDTIGVRYHSVPGEEDFAPVPHQEARSLYGIRHRVNSIGLRGPERPLAKPPGIKRMVILGDSFVWGFGVPVEQSFVSLLDHSLAPGWEVWNLGLQATNTFNEKARFARLAPLIHPDLTVVVILFNDLQPAAQHFRITPQGTLSLADRKPPFPDSWRPWLERSALYNLVVRLYTRAEGRNDDYNPAYIPRLLGQLDQIGAIAAEHHSPLILVVTPGIWPKAAQYDLFAAALAGYAKERSLTLVNLESALGRPVDRHLFLRFDPVHPNAEGHRRIARILEPVLAQAAKKTAADEIHLLCGGPPIPPPGTLAPGRN